MPIPRGLSRLQVPVLVLFLALSLTLPALAQEYTFKVHNNAGVAITKILVSEDGKKWGQFDIGAGIAPRATVTLAWDESTNNQECKQHFQAVFADGSVSDPAIFDFCDTSLVVEFSN